MGILEATRTCFSKFATFSGRASRPEYWWFYLFVMLVSVVTRIIDHLLFGATSAHIEATTEGVSAAVSAEAHSEPLTSIWGLLVLLPFLAVGWRRAHDSGAPGWYIFLPAIASLIGLFGLFLGVAGFGLMENAGADPEKLRGIAGTLGIGGMLVMAVIVLALSIYKIVLMVRPSEPQANAYGPPPTR